jgi:hypothetical protein
VSYVNSARRRRPDSRSNGRDIGAAVSSAEILWRRLDTPGHDAAALHAIEDGWAIEGTAVFLHGDEACSLRYTARTDQGWVTRAAEVAGWIGSTPVHVLIVASANHQWSLNGVPQPAVAGCVDIDLSFTPATNLIPVRRLQLRVGAREAITAAWVKFPDLILEPLEQAYAHTSDNQYDYEAFGGAFRVPLLVDPNGWVVRYPGFWQREGVA